ncbi:peptide ABC transporter ATP-binding protein [Bombilactobacillus bombi]|uniref:Peptide ABC transporter ATP-binding protein n=1 Tax=Bombilactobacillus bombi TaxID=1303590 RepID=A0A3R6XTI9_9LACO|nr:peptide cleavage/export ABC transporter [Bombilactobacillus bombi]RHW48551.1 peptide ABC transporter ATP-binding protein [Bombilactobacillus bombi]
MKPQKIYSAQTSTQDSGLAALLMLFKHYHQAVSEKQLQEYYHQVSADTSIARLQKVAEHFGLEAQVIQTDMRLFKEQHLSYPFIAHVVKGQELDHYYVVLQADKKDLLVADPNPKIGIVRLSYEQFQREWTGLALFAAPLSPDVVDNQQSLKQQLFSIMRQQKTIVMGIMVAALCELVVSILGAFFIEGLIDTYLPNKMIKTFTIVALGLLVAYLFQAVFAFVRHFLMSIFDQHWTLDRVLAATRQLLKLPLAFWQNKAPAELLNLINQMAEPGISQLLNIILDVAVVIVLGVILAFQNGILLVLAVLSLPLSALIIWLFNQPLYQLQQQQLTNRMPWNEVLEQSLAKIETLKAFGIEEQAYQLFDQKFSAWLQSQLEYKHKRLLQQAFQLGLLFCLSGLVLLVGANLVVKSWLTSGQLVTFSILLVYFMLAVQKIVNLQPQLQRTFWAQQQLKSLAPTASTATVATAEQVQGPLFIKQLEYHNLIKNIDLTLMPQDKLAIVGRSGSGKTTLAQLLAGLQQPTSGQIQLNGHELVTITAPLLRQQITYLPQIPQLIPGTILDNLKLGGRDNLTWTEIEATCAAVQIKDKIEKLPLKYDTHLDYSRPILSTGQKQQLLLARALLSKAQILILDEATGAIDAITEAQIIKQLLESQQTVVFITQNLELARKINNIAVLEQGKIVEQGSQRELLAQKGEYYQLFKAARSRKNG